MKSKFLSSISVFCGGAILLTGCGKKETIDSSSKSDSTTTSITSTCPTTVLSTTTLTYPVTTTLVTSTSMSTLMSMTNSTVSSVVTDLSTIYTTCTFTDTDSEILDVFDKIGDSVRDSFDTAELLDKGKSYFIYCVDFLFYDGEIKGIKFEDLTDSAKQQLLLDITTIDSLICAKYPDYKEDIKEGYGNAYNKASEVIREGSANIKDFSKEKLGEDNYNKIGEYKDMFVDITRRDFDTFLDILGIGKEKVRNKYEDFKNKRTD